MFGVSARVRVLAALLAMLVFAVYAQVANHGFVSLDDGFFIYNNPRVLQGLNPRTILWSFTATENCNWYPLTRLTHLADLSLFGLWAGGHHLVSVAWHAAAAVLLFLALYLMTGGLWRALFVAALFAVHPLNVESVAWASERSMVLAGFFFALTLLLWTRYVRQPNRRRYLAALIAAALGLATKPVLVSLPFVLLLLDAWPFCRLDRRGSARARTTASGLRGCVLEKVPFFVLATASSIVTFVVQKQGGAMLPLEVMPLSVRLANTPLSYWHYLGKYFWPARLAIFYPHPTVDLHLGRAAAAGVLLAAMTGFIIVIARRNPALGVGWFWYLGTLVPMIGLVQVGDQAIADRYAYLPSIGIFLALAYVAVNAMPSWNKRGLLLGVAATAIILALSTATVAYVDFWKDSATLFSHSLSMTRNNARLEHILGNALLRDGRLEEAIVHYRAALRLRPADVTAHLNVALALSGSGQLTEAEPHYRRALQLQPDNAAAHNNFGLLLYRMDRLVEAEAQYREALRLNPGHAIAHNNLGFLLQETGRLAEGEQHYREAIRLKPDYANSHRNLGELLNRRGMSQEADEHLRIAERLRSTP